MNNDIIAFNKIKMNDLLLELRDTMPMCNSQKSFTYDDSITNTLENAKQNGKEVLKNTDLNVYEKVIKENQSSSRRTYRFRENNIYNTSHRFLNKYINTGYFFILLPTNS